MDLNQVLENILKYTLGLYFLFAFCYKGGVTCVSEVIDISPGSLDSNLCFIS